MAADIVINVWTCSGTPGQAIDLLGRTSPNCSGSSAWTTYTIKQPDMPNMANTEQFLYYGIEILVFGLGAWLFAAGYKAGMHR